MAGVRFRMHFIDVRSVNARFSLGSLNDRSLYVCYVPFVIFMWWKEDLNSGLTLAGLLVARSQGVGCSVMVFPLFFFKGFWEKWLFAASSHFLVSKPNFSKMNSSEMKLSRKYWDQLLDFIIAKHLMGAVQSRQFECFKKSMKISWKLCLFSKDRWDELSGVIFFIFSIEAWANSETEGEFSKSQILPNFIRTPRTVDFQRKVNRSYAKPKKGENESDGEGAEDAK